MRRLFRWDELRGKMAWWVDVLEADWIKVCLWIDHDTPLHSHPWMNCKCKSRYCSSNSSQFGPLTFVVDHDVDLLEINMQVNTHTRRWRSALKSVLCLPISWQTNTRLRLVDFSPPSLLNYSFCNL